ncbi:unnamed protein product [Brassica rapa subsp. narinosa]
MLCVTTTIDKNESNGPQCTKIKKINFFFSSLSFFLSFDFFVSSNLSLNMLPP